METLQIKYHIEVMTSKGIKNVIQNGKAFSLKLIHHYHLFALKKHLQHLQIAYGRVSSCTDPHHSEITKCCATASLNTVDMKYTTTKIDCHTSLEQSYS
jgi:hypothetical protein